MSQPAGHFGSTLTALEIAVSSQTKRLEIHFAFRWWGRAEGADQDVIRELDSDRSAVPLYASATSEPPSTTANIVEIEGVESYKGQKAWLKVGYQFQFESSSSVAVLKTSNVARIQTGTLTCTRQGRGDCTVRFDRNFAACSQSCYFVGYRGGAKSQ